MKKKIAIFLLSCFVLIMFGLEIRDSIVNENMLGFYSSNSNIWLIPISIALLSGLIVYFFCFYISPKKRRIAGLVWWGIGNFCLLCLVGGCLWIVLKLFKSLQSPYVSIVKVANDHLPVLLVWLVCTLLIFVFSCYLWIKKYKKFENKRDSSNSDFATAKPE